MSRFMAANLTTKFLHIARLPSWSSDLNFVCRRTILRKMFMQVWAACAKFSRHSPVIRGDNWTGHLAKWFYQYLSEVRTIWSSGFFCQGVSQNQ